MTSCQQRNQRRRKRPQGMFTP